VKAGGQLGLASADRKVRDGFGYHRNCKNKERDQPQWKKLESEPDVLGLLRLHDPIMLRVPTPSLLRLVMRTAEMTARPIAIS